MSIVIKLANEPWTSELVKKVEGIIKRLTKKNKRRKI
jgi:hypothetical protein